MMLHGDVPVSDTDKLVDPPAHIEAVPPMLAVGVGRTVMAALPEVVPVQ